MAKSGVQLKDHDKGKAAKEFRTSSQYFLPTTDDALLEAIDARVMRLTRVPISHAEFIQVLRYNHMEHYSAHHDFFDPAAYKSDAQMLRMVEHGARNRLATVFFYLNNVSAGGQTNFPRAQTREQPLGGRVPTDYFDCSRGLSVHPQLGKVIIFYSLLPDGQMDEFSLHGGCDVLDPAATKWSANFWLWNKPTHFQSPVRQRQTEELQSEWM
uniref:Fe2OG dioxygenase domain-containing protein n=1 Tax=Calcidiscus leptoporus TaxID=127549 RepID=A0A7S0J860_9EUKA